MDTSLQQRLNGMEMGIKERLSGFRRPVYLWIADQLACDEDGWVRPVHLQDEREFALGYIEGYAPSQAIEA